MEERFEVKYWRGEYKSLGIARDSFPEVKLSYTSRPVGTKCFFRRA
jgi:hypothetical protein